MQRLNQIISWWGMGSGGDASRRHTQWIQPDTGWAGFVDRQIQPLRALGVNRFWLHTPMGHAGVVRNFPPVGDTNIRFDQLLEAREKPSLRWLTRGFAKAWLPLTRADVQVVAYLGTLPGAPEFDDLARGRQRDFFDRLTKSIRPFLDAGCDLALDSSVLSKPGHYVYEFVQLLKSRGIRTYIESMPRVDAPHWFGADIVSSEEQFQAASNPGNQHILAPPERLTGEIVRGFWSAVNRQKYADHRAWYRAEIPAALARGHSVCLGLVHFLNAGGRLNELAG